MNRNLSISFVIPLPWVAEQHNSYPDTRILDSWCVNGPGLLDRVCEVGPREVMNGEMLRMWEAIAIEQPDLLQRMKGQQRPDTILIAHAVNMLPKLVAALKELSASVSAMTGMTDEEPSPFLSEHGKSAFYRNKEAQSVLAEANNPEVSK